MPYRIYTSIVLSIWVAATGWAAASCDVKGEPMRYGVRDVWVVKDKPWQGEADFAPICLAHQACYETPNQLQQTCDREFRDALKKECRTSLYDFQARRACEDNVDNAFKFVQEKAGDDYREGQRKARALQRKQERSEREDRRKQYSKEQRQKRYEERLKKRMEARRKGNLEQPE